MNEREIFDEYEANALGGEVAALQAAGDIAAHLISDLDMVKGVRAALARELHRVLQDPSELQEMRDSSYAGIQAAVGVPAPERTSSRRRDPAIIETFVKAYRLDD